MNSIPLRIRPAQTDKEIAANTIGRRECFFPFCDLSSEREFRQKYIEDPTNKFLDDFRGSVDLLSVLKLQNYIVFSSGERIGRELVAKETKAFMGVPI